MRTSWIVPPEGIWARIGMRGNTIERRATASARRAAKRARLRKTPPRHENKLVATGRASGDQALDKIHDGQMNQVVPRCEHHQRHPQGKTAAEAVFLRLLSERPAADRFGGIKQQMTAVKN